MHVDNIRKTLLTHATQKACTQTQKINNIVFLLKDRSQPECGGYSRSQSEIKRCQC